ncbi:MAG: hypothetical protein IKE55_04135 [Kiritimatiellae bacterium]|nr:hypothetical protein [Kiritimatiellia bacterium]
MLRRAIMLSAALAAGHLHAFYEVQDVVLRAGWNAFYLKVQPDRPADEVFADWPVDSVSAYLPDAFSATRQDMAAMSDEDAPARTFLVWQRASGAASSMNAVHGDSVLVCYNKSASAFSARVVGRPVAPRIAWHPAKASSDTLNYVGFSLQPGARVTPARYFRGCDSGVASWKMLYGADATNIQFVALSDGYEVSDGNVVLADAMKASSWSGALYASPRHGVDFGAALTRATVSVRNDTTTNITVEAAWFRGVSPEGRVDGAPLLVELKYRDAAALLGDGRWADFGAGTNKVLAAGETWQLQLGLDRTQAAFANSAPGAEVGGVLRFRDVDGGSAMEVKIPVAAKVQPPGANMWPAGLWAVDLNLGEVTMVTDDSTLVDGIASGGRPSVRLYLHVSDEGKMTLLQRLNVVAQASGTDGGVELAAYGPESDVPGDAQRVVRLSSAFMPVDVPAVEGTGAFLGSAEFSFTVASDSPSNPFRHSFHPSHDGLDADRKSALPDGTDFANYASTVKPETFSVGNRVLLEWDADSAPAVWDPDDELEGKCRWTFTHLRKEGDIAAGGRFVMRRVLKNGTLR